MIRGRAGVALCCQLAVAISLLGSASAVAAPTEPLGHAGRWITDAQGRTVILHGVNFVPLPFGRTATLADTPEAVGFGADDADFLAAQGFNTLRLGFAWGTMEPQPGSYDEAYLASYERTQRLLAGRGMFTLLDFHQDQYAPSLPGRGFPEWAVFTDGFPPLGMAFPLGYVADPAQWRAWDNFWGNREGPGGVPLQERLGAMWRHVAARFAGAPGLLGYDLLNEPWPGTVWPLCANPIGCPPGGFDQTQLTEFSRRMVDAVREADNTHLAFAEPNLEFDFGAATGLGDLADANAGLSFHDYCIGAAPGLPALPDILELCEIGERLVLQNAEAYSQRTGAALLLTEFADTADAVIHRRVMRLVDEAMMSWQMWGWSFANGAVLLDPSRPPTPDNLREGILDEIVRPYPQVTAGTPLRYWFDRGSRRFEFAYSTVRPDGAGAFETGGDPLPRTSPTTEVFIPERQYPEGYELEIDGAGVASAPNERLLRLIACPGVSEVAIRVTAPGGANGNSPDCAVAAPGTGAALGSSTTGPRSKRCKRRKAKRKAGKRKRRCARRKKRRRR